MKKRLNNIYETIRLHELSDLARTELNHGLYVNFFEFLKKREQIGALLFFKQKPWSLDYLTILENLIKHEVGVYYQANYFHQFLKTKRTTFLKMVDFYDYEYVQGLYQPKVNLQKIPDFNHLQNLDLIILPIRFFNDKNQAVCEDEYEILHKLKKLNPKAKIIGLAYDFANLKDAFFKKNNFLCDFIITEKQIY